MKIQIPLPFSGKAGGTIALFELAGALQQLGCETTVTVPVLNCGFKDHRIKSLIQAARSSVSDLIHRRRRWFPFPDLVKTVPYLSSGLADEFDLSILGSWPLAYLHRNYRQPQRLLYWIQGIETWQGAESKARLTHRLPIPKAVTTRWLQSQLQFGKGEGTPPVVPLGVDSRFKTGPSRNFEPPWRFLCAFHELKQEQFHFGLDVISQLRKSGTDIQLTVVSPVPIETIEEADMVIAPSPSQLTEIYNNQHFFLYPTFNDGWGMMVTEAMASGVINITNPVGFAHDYGCHLNNLVIPQGNNQKAYLAAIRTILSDPEHLKRMSERGVETTAELTWTRTATRIIMLAEGYSKVSK